MGPSKITLNQGQLYNISGKSWLVREIIPFYGQNIQVSELL